MTCWHSELTTVFERIRPICKSARLYLWPAAALNAFAVSLALGVPLVPGSLVSASLCLLASFGFVLNDLWDRNVDRMNTAGRLENANRTTCRLAWGSVALLLAGGLSLAALAGWRPFLLALTVATGLTLYTILVRRVLLAATLLSAILGTSPLWGPIILWETSVSQRVWLLLLSICLMFAAREILLDVKDEVGDRLALRHTFATIFGSRIATKVAVLIVLCSTGALLRVVYQATGGLSITAASFLWSTTALFLYLTLWPALVLTATAQNSPQPIRAYITRSRAGMLVLSVLVSILLQR